MEDGKIPIIGDVLEKIGTTYQAGKEKQHVVVRAGIEAVVKGIPQGMACGVASYKFQGLTNSLQVVSDKMSPDQRKAVEAQRAMQPKNMAQSARNFVALFATQYAVAELLYEYRKKKDKWSLCAPHVISRRVLHASSCCLLNREAVITS